MSILISVVISLLQILSNHPAVSHADIMVTRSGISPQVDEQQVYPLFYSSSLREGIGVVPASPLTSCYKGQHHSVTLNPSDLPSDGPTCISASSRTPSASTAKEHLFIFPLTEEDTLEEGTCVAITAPQSYCNIPSGSSLSAFPLV